MELRVKLRRLGRVQRKTYLEQYYGLKTNREIALDCGVHESTIDRDIADWKASGEYDEYLDHRWHQYLEDPEIDKRTKFQALTRLKIRRQVEKPEETVGLKKHVVDITVLQKYRFLIREIIQDTGEPLHTGETSP